MLVRCLYASRAATPFDETMLDGILTQSRKNNPLRGITGMLCFANDIFVQVLEGGRADVAALFGAIIRDARNTDVQMLSYEEISERRFGNWTMGQVNLANINPALLLKFSERAELNPFTCTAAATMALLQEIAATGCIISRSS